MKTVSKTGYLLMVLPIATVFMVIASTIVIICSAFNSLKLKMGIKS